MSSKRLSLSSAPLALLQGSPFYDLPATLEVMHLLFSRGLADGFEFQLLAEWDHRRPPRVDAETSVPIWERCAKHTYDQLLELLSNAQLPITSVHASRDIGPYLASNSLEGEELGCLLLRESLAFTRDMGIGICVVHAWDTWQPHVNSAKIVNLVTSIAGEYPEVTATIENIPTRMPATTPVMLVKDMPALTLDLKWAELFAEFKLFAPLLPRIKNTHLRGELIQGQWMLRAKPLTDYITELLLWGYSGLLTLEPDGLSRCTLDEFASGLLKLRETIRILPSSSEGNLPLSHV